MGFILKKPGKLGVVGTADGADWRADDNGNVVELRHDTPQVVRMLSIPETALILLAYTTGDIELLETDTEERNIILRTGHAIKDVTMSSNGRVIVVADDSSVVHL